MTGNLKRALKTAAAPGRWALQDAKARLSELIRRALSEGPQHITVHGRDEVVIVSSEEFNKLAGGQTGAALIEALQSCPDPELEIVSARERAPVRDVDL
jgi:prevent-host-death family protein